MLCVRTRGFEPHSRHFFFEILILVCFMSGMGGILGVLKNTSREIHEKKIEAGFWGSEGRDIGLSTKTASNFTALSVRKSIVQT